MGASCLLGRAHQRGAGSRGPPLTPPRNPMANRPPRKVSIAEANHNMWRKMEAGGTGRPELFAPLCPLLLILDANAAMADVQAMARRRDPEALTDLRRAIRDQSVLVFAPEVLRD